jgi:quinol monooxygenase YgiN
MPWYKPQSPEERAAFEAHKQTPEYKTAQQELERAWAKLAGRATMGATA